jgi:hypothetical protein
LLAVGQGEISSNRYVLLNLSIGLLVWVAGFGAKEDRRSALQDWGAAVLRPYAWMCLSKMGRQRKVKGF